MSRYGQRMRVSTYTSTWMTTGDEGDFSGGSLSGSSLLDIFDSYKYITNQAPTVGGTLTVNGLSLGSYDYVVKNSSTTVSSFINSEFFTSVEDTSSSLVMINGNFTINSGQTFIPSQRKLFIAIYVTGNLIVDGSISMTARGASHSATTEQAIKLTSSTTIPASGAGSTGNGGAGAGTRGATGGPGATGTVFSGGPGGGGKSIEGTGASGSARGGQGGAGAGYNSQNGGAPGAGNPGGSTNGGSNSPAGNGTGGTIFIFVKGTISGSGSISSSGSAGGNASWQDGSSGGGGSGGGHITVCRASGTSPTLTVGGGAGGVATNGAFGVANGSAGGTGTSQTVGLT